MKKLLGGILVLLAAVLLIGCRGNAAEAITSSVGGLVGSGNPISRQYDLAGFTNVSASAAFQVEIARGETFSVQVSADDNLIDHVKVGKEGDTLVLGLDGKGTSLVIHQPLKASVTMPDLRELRLSGAARGTVTGFKSPNHFVLDVSGASSLEGDTEIGDSDVTVSGASHIRLKGSGQDMNLNASGASTVDLAAFPLNNAEVTLSGAGNATVNVNGTLHPRLSGASSLRYVGSPAVEDASVSGASSLNRKRD